MSSSFCLFRVESHDFSQTKKGTIQVLRHQRGGWGQKMAIFDDLQYCKSSKRWVGLKKSKT